MRYFTHFLLVSLLGKDQKLVANDFFHNFFPRNEFYSNFSSII